MKNQFLIFVLCIMVTQSVYAQTDSVKAPEKSYKRNIQGLLFNGIIALSYEQALNKHTSLRFRAAYRPQGHFPFRKSFEMPLAIFFQYNTDIISIKTGPLMKGFICMEHLPFRMHIVFRIVIMIIQSIKFI